MKAKKANSSTFEHVDRAEEYARQVVAGKIPACKWVRRACERHFRDLEHAKAGWIYEFDRSKAERVCRFIELLPHVKGKWAKKDPATGKAQRLKLEPWQCFIVAMIFGWVKVGTGTRRFRKASAYIPRKNAKSTLAAGIGWWMFAKDGEPGAEVYSGATTEKQAWEVFGPARQMAATVPALPRELRVKVNAASMIRLDDNSKFEPVIGKPGDGASPHCAIVDEYHEHDTSVLYDTMITGMGAREQPLLLVISTAGDNLAGPCRDDWKLSEKILDGLIEDETHFAIIWTMDDGDDWTSELALRKANPNFDVSVSKDFLLAQLTAALNSPRDQGTYKTKHLNLWVNAKAGYFNVQLWHNLKRQITLDDLKGQQCYLSADFASKHDLVSLIALFPMLQKRFRVFGRHYLPRATVSLPHNQHYRAWEAAGRMTVTDGNITDVDRLIEDAIWFNANFRVLEMPIDPNRAWGVSTTLQKAGLNVVEYRNVVLTMSEPMKTLDALIRDSRIEHDGDPVLSWAISNVTAQEDKKSNVYPNKESNEQKIDPVVSLIMALGRATIGGGAEPSIYESRGIDYIETDSEEIKKKKQAPLEKYCQYLRNVGGRKIQTSKFDDDWNPVGPDVRRRLLDAGFAYEQDGLIVLSPVVVKESDAA